MIGNALAVMNGKGGVGKTSLVAQLAGLAALGGWKVLVVELDRQANLGRDLGFLPRSDDGRGLLAAVEGTAPLHPLDNVRPNLDVVPAGSATRSLYARFGSSNDGGLPRFDQLDVAVGEIAGRYDLVLFDCPPGEQNCQLAALVASRAVLIPTHVDDASLDGVALVLSGVLSVVKGPNPSLDVLGVVVTGVQTQAKKILKLARQELAGRVGGDGGLRVYDETIRFVQGPAFYSRRLGMLVHELEAAAKDQPKFYERVKSGGVATDALPTSSGGLAEDYEALSKAILRDFTELMGD